ncbi:MAG: Uma2 family endonuclease [Myxococcota bacterium]
MAAEARALDRDDSPKEDKILVLHDATWADYQRVMEIRGDHSAPRIAFLEGALEIMSPSASHERIKSTIGRLVEVYCLERDIDFQTLGSWTLEDKAVARGVEPDECYLFGGRSADKRPDLAIEVVWTSGGIRKLEIYRKLGVKEVWFWRRGRVSVHRLDGETYVDSAKSSVLPGIDLEELGSYLDQPTTSAAMRAYRDALRAPS